METKATDRARSIASGDEGTAWEAFDPPPYHSETASHAVERPEVGRRLRIRAAQLRDHVDLLNLEVIEVHHDAQDYDLEELAQKKARRSVSSLLADLGSDRGMSWSDIARLVGVSPSAIRKWRREGSATGENRLALARLAAFMDLLEGFAIEDPASWLEVPLVDGYTVTALDVYVSKGGAVLLLDYADTRVAVTELLDESLPDWRERFGSAFEVYEAADGHPAIRQRSNVH